MLEYFTLLQKIPFLFTCRNVFVFVVVLSIWHFKILGSLHIYFTNIYWVPTICRSRVKLDIVPPLVEHTAFQFPPRCNRSTTTFFLLLVIKNSRQIWSATTWRLKSKRKHEFLLQLWPVHRLQSENHARTGGQNCSRSPIFMAWRCGKWTPQFKESMRNPCFPFVVFPQGQILLMTLWATTTQRKTPSSDQRNQEKRPWEIKHSADLGEEKHWRMRFLSSAYEPIQVPWVISNCACMRQA